MDECKPLPMRHSTSCPMVMRDGMACGFTMMSGTMPSHQGLTLVHFSAQPKPSWSHLPVSPCLIDWEKIMHPTYPTKSAYVEPKSGTSVSPCLARERHVLLRVRHADGPLLPVPRRKLVTNLKVGPGIKTRYSISQMPTMSRMWTIPGRKSVSTSAGLGFRFRV